MTTQSDLTRSDIAHRPYVVRYVSGTTEGFVGFKSADHAENFKIRAAEFGSVSDMDAGDLPNGWWRPVENFQMRGINFAISVSGGKLWTVR